MTYLSVFLFYCAYLSAFLPKFDENAIIYIFTPYKRVFESLNANNSLATKKFQDALESSTLQACLIHIKSNFECLLTAVKQLYEQRLSLCGSIQITEKINEIFMELQGQHSDIIKTKFDSLLSNIHSYKMICNISDIMSGKEKNVYFIRFLMDTF